MATMIASRFVGIFSHVTRFRTSTMMLVSTVSAPMMATMAEILSVSSINVFLSYLAGIFNTCPTWMISEVRPFRRMISLAFLI